MISPPLQADPCHWDDGGKLKILQRPTAPNGSTSHLRFTTPNNHSAMSDSVLPGISGYNPHNLQPWTVEVVTSVTALATVAVALRLLSRHIKAQKLWWDDYMIIFSLVCVARYCSRRMNTR